ncbi:TLC domain-containing protein [Dactylonectria estremocensis]|uniref:TLC domain-containing protein n=1 Tax=Dactylonectria estremocensis TaxID=1079267 RepID=A0A9P9FE00_9HYPO|nr:TLC domain-containing protein [Dactylonectria estremocensis]
MRDPFFIKPIPWLSEQAQPWADYFGLPTLPLHIHEVLFAALLYSVIFYPISPLLSNWLAPAHYSKLPRKRRLNWDAHVVSMFQSILINGLAIWVMLTDDELNQMTWQERVWGYTGGSGFIQAFAAGYFLWDLIVTSLNFDVFGIGTLAHAIAALFVYSLGFRPFVNYYACVFILWELSTPFLNVHWFMDKVNMTGSRAQLYNGLMLLFTFFCCRLVYGTYSSFCVFHDIWSSINASPNLSKLELSPTLLFATQESTVPLWLAATYLLSNLTLNGLNFYWFFMMIRAVRKRFDPPKAVEKHSEYITEAQIEASPVASGVEKPTINGRRRKA